MGDKMKPCPFCGRTSKTEVKAYCIDDGWNCRTKGEEAWAVSCECSCEGPWGSTKEEAELLWDTRV